MTVDMLEPPEDDDRDEEEQPEAPPTVIDEATLQPRKRTMAEVKALGQEMWQEYSQGMTQTQIAAMHGVSPRMVHYYLSRYARHYGRREIERAKNKDLDRIESMIDALWEKAIKNHKIQAVRTIAQLILVRERILGYGAPRKTQVSGEVQQGVSPEMATLLRELHQRNEAIRGELKRQEEPIDAEVVDE